MTAKDKNNKTIREADWISCNNRMYQVHFIFDKQLIMVWWKYTKKNKKVIRLSRARIILTDSVTKVDSPMAYNITDE